MGCATPDALLSDGWRDWAVKEIALGLQPHLSPSFGKVEIIDQVLQRPYLSRTNIHCLCRPAFFKGAGIPPIHSSNRLVVCWLHGGKKSREPEMLNACRQLERHWRKVRRFIVPNTITQRHVLECGVDPRIVHVIPNGVDIRLFHPVENTDQRLAKIGAHAQGFVYAVARKGVTGSQTDFGSELIEFIARCRQATDLPLAIGFGLRSGEDLRQVHDRAEIGIVGSELLNTWERAGETGYTTLLRDLAAGRD